MIDKEKLITVLGYILLTSVLYILIYNVLAYDPILGYDAEAHYGYIDYFARYLPSEIKLPLVDDTREFFNPPIAYIYPSIIQVICRNILEADNLLLACQPIYGKLTQIFQSLLYLVTLFVNMHTLKQITKSPNLININYLLLISLMAVNYRTISMIRGEVYIVFFLSLLLNRFLKIKNSSFEFKLIEVVIFGTLIGLLALSRQWAFLLFPAFFVMILFVSKEQRIKYMKFLFGSLSIGFILSSWFYFNLFFEYGSFTAFNMKSSGFSFSNQPTSFYLPFNSEASYLFKKPIRPYFSNQFFPIVYSDLWGDYWGYFVFTSRFLDIGRNQLLIGDYLARVNIVSLIPSIILLYSYFSLKSRNSLFLKYIKYSIIFSLAGYLWFTISYPVIPSGDNIKTTYMIQLFHLLVFLSALKLEEIKKDSYKIYTGILFLLSVSFVHNFSTYLSHFPIEYIKNL